MGDQGAVEAVGVMGAVGVVGAMGLWGCGVGGCGGYGGCGTVGVWGEGLWGCGGVEWGAVGAQGAVGVMGFVETSDTAQIEVTPRASGMQLGPRAPGRWNQVASSPGQAASCPSSRWWLREAGVAGPGMPPFPSSRVNPCPEAEPGGSMGSAGNSVTYLAHSRCSCKI